MSRGPKRQSADVALRKGNPGKRNKVALEQAAAVDNSMPPDAVEIPDCPLPLTKRAAEHWRAVCAYLVPLGRIKTGDLRQLARYCNYLSDYDACRESITTAGGKSRITYETESTVGAKLIKLRPELLYIKELEGKMLAIEREFGLTPAARATVTSKLLDAAAGAKIPPAGRSAPAPAAGSTESPDAPPAGTPDVPPAPASPIGLLNTGRTTKH